MAASPLSVACVGLGRIGSGIAQSIQRTGHRLIVYNRTAEKTASFVASGATAASTPREAAAQADIVLTCLMDDDSVRQNLLGAEGILAGMRPGAIHIGTSTVTPVAAAEFANLHATHGSHYVTATFAGHPEHAAAGKLITFVSGDPKILERSRPVLEAYSGKLIVVGDDPVLAASFKLAVNFFLACLLEAIGEALVFGEAQGLNLETLGTMLKDLLQHPAIPKYLDKIRAGNFDQVLSSTLNGVGSKDVRLILQTAAESSVPLAFGSVVQDKIIAAQAHGWGECDWSVLTEISRVEAGRERPFDRATTA